MVRESALVEALAQLFHLLWEQAHPLVPEPVDDGVTEADQRLVAMLASGMKDDAIARQLNVSSRTVGRRVADLMEMLGARTRSRRVRTPSRAICSAPGSTPVPTSRRLMDG